MQLSLIERMVPPHDGITLPPFLARSDWAPLFGVTMEFSVILEKSLDLASLFLGFREQAQTPEYVGQVPLVDQVARRRVYGKGEASVHLETLAEDEWPDAGRRKDRPCPIPAAQDEESARTSQQPLASNGWRRLARNASYRGARKTHAAADEKRCRVLPRSGGDGLTQP
jgi:hypothetical protein